MPSRTGGGPMLKFDDELEVEGNGVVIATGPFDPEVEEIIELCAWVYQRDPNGNELGATEMTEHHGDHHELLRNAEGAFTVHTGADPHDGHWRLPLGRVGQGDLQPGEAFGVAVAMISETANGNQRVIWWGHPLRLKAAGA